MPPKPYRLVITIEREKRNKQEQRWLVVLKANVNLAGRDMSIKKNTLDWYVPTMVTSFCQTYLYPVT